MWRELYPAGIHYLIGQILGSAVLLWLAGHVGNARERYYSYTLVITGLTGVLVMFPAVYFYRKDRIVDLYHDKNKDHYIEHSTNRYIFS